MKALGNQKYNGPRCKLRTVTLFLEFQFFEYFLSPVELPKLFRNRRTRLVPKLNFRYPRVTMVALIAFYWLIIKITISSILFGLKNSYFPLIHLPSCYWTACYRTVQQTNQIQSCSLNQPITTLVSITIDTVYNLLNLCILCQFFNVKFPFVT